MSSNKNIIWLASYPKSGNTWVRLFLQNILAGKHEGKGIINLSEIPIASNRALLDDNLGVNSSDLSQAEIMDYRPLIYKSISEKIKWIQVLKTHDLFGTTSAGSPIFPYEITKFAVYVVRNPLDVAVSFSQHSGKTIQTIINQMNDPSFEISNNEKGLKSQVSQHLGTWSEHVQSWTEQKKVPIFVIKYEELLVNGKYIFRELLKHIGISYSEDNFEHAIKSVEFNHLKKMENVYGFREKPLQAVSFFREGKKDTYKDFLSKYQIEEVRKNHLRIMTKFGYLNEKA